MSGLENAMHLAHGESAANHIQAVTGSARCTRDLLTRGPCDADPTRHQALRAAYWGVTDWDTGLGPELAALPPAQPIVIWATSAWSDQLWLWWTLDVVSRHDIARERLWWAQPRTDHPLASAGAAPPDELRVAVTRAQPISDAQLAGGASLWLKYADPSPLAFDQARRTGSPAFPDLSQIAEPHGYWFPRLVDGALRLSELDESLLSSLRGDWRLPRKLMGDDRLMFPFGDSMLMRRLEEWVRQGAVERQDPGAYRLSQTGARLLAAGLPDVAEAPSLHIGGCRVNDPTAPWVRVIDRNCWRLEQGRS